MTRYGFCMVPFEPHGWIQPLPTVASWRAAKAIGLTDCRLQFDVSIASPSIGVWRTNLFESFFNPLVDAMSRVNINYCISQELPHMDQHFHEEAAAWIALHYGHVADSFSFGNEPGPLADAYEAEHPGSDYMRDVYFPRYVIPFTRGIRRVKPDAWIGGCDADSADIQRKYISTANHLMLAASDLICSEEFIHSYGDTGGGNYATLTAFAAARDSLGESTRRPWGISEIDHQQLPSARLRAEHTTFVFEANGASKSEAALQGALARLQPTEPESRAMLDYARKIRSEAPECTRLYFGSVEYFFERGVRPDNGLPCSSFYLPEPKLSKVGQEFGAEFGEKGGPVAPQPKKVAGRTTGRRP